MMDLVTATPHVLVLGLRYIAKGFADVTNPAHDAFEVAPVQPAETKFASKTTDVSVGNSIANAIRFCVETVAWSMSWTL